MDLPKQNSAFPIILDFSNNWIIVEEDLDKVFNKRNDTEINLSVFNLKVKTTKSIVDNSKPSNTIVFDLLWCTKSKFENIFCIYIETLLKTNYSWTGLARNVTCSRGGNFIIIGDYRSFGLSDSWSFENVGGQTYNENKAVITMIGVRGATFNKPDSESGQGVFF